MAIACAIMLCSEVRQVALEETLKAIRKELNISQEQLARELNVSYTTINRWENVRRTPSRLARMRLAEFCVDKGVSQEIIDALKHV